MKYRTEPADPSDTEVLPEDEYLAEMEREEYEEELAEYQQERDHDREFDREN